MVEAVPITMQVPDGRHQLIMGAIEIGAGELAGAERRPQPPAIRAGAEPRAFVAARQHGADRQHDRRHVGADGAHQLGRNGLVAAADQHHGIERQRPHHFLDVHRHQVAQQHRGREREGLMQRNGREHEGQRAGKPHAPRHRLGEPAGGGVTGIEIGCRGQNADDRPVERLVGEARALQKAAAQEQREFLVAILGEPRPQPFFHHKLRPEAIARHSADARSRAARKRRHIARSGRRTQP